MSKVRYSEEELMSDHDYACGHEEDGVKLHGGFDAEGAYISPRTKVRWPAIDAWKQQLRDQGNEVLDVTTELLTHGSFPTYEQQKLLIRNGLGKTFWNSLTVTGIIEGRGQMLAEITAPDFQEIVEEDISGTLTAHLNKGLLKAHGYDEGSNPETGEGGHNIMWFAVRDLIFGRDAYPLIEPADRGARPGAGTREMPDLPEAYEGLIKSLMNVLMIEIRAEHFFNFCTDVIRDQDLFQDRPEAAAHAADLVDRIKEDERSHVAYLTTFISELRTFTFKTVDGGTKPGHEIIDPVWARIVEYQANQVPLAGRDEQREEIKTQIAELPNGGDLAQEFDSLEAA